MLQEVAKETYPRGEKKHRITKMLERFFQERKLADTAQGNVNSAQTVRMWVRLREKNFNTEKSLFT